MDKTERPWSVIHREWICVRLQFGIIFRMYVIFCYLVKGSQGVPWQVTCFVVHKSVACYGKRDTPGVIVRCQVKSSRVSKYETFFRPHLIMYDGSCKRAPFLLVSTRDALSRALASIAFVHTKRKMSARRDTSCIETRCQKSVMVISNWRCLMVKASSGNCADISKLLGRDPKTQNEKITTFLE